MTLSDCKLCSWDVLLMHACSFTVDALAQCLGSYGMAAATRLDRCVHQVQSYRAPGAKDCFRLALGALLQVCKLTALRNCAHSQHWRRCAHSEHWCRGEDILQAPLEDVQALLHLSGGDVERRQEADGLARTCGCRVRTEQLVSSSHSSGSSSGSRSTLNATHQNCSSLQPKVMHNSNTLLTCPHEQHAALGGGVREVGRCVRAGRQAAICATKLGR